MQFVFMNSRQEHVERAKTLLSEIAEDSGPQKPAPLSLRLDSRTVDELKEAAKNADVSVNELVGRLIRATIRLPPFSLRMAEDLTRLLRSDTFVEPIKERILEDIYVHVGHNRLRWNSFPRERLLLVDFRVAVSSGAIELSWALPSVDDLVWTIGKKVHSFTKMTASGTLAITPGKDVLLSNASFDFCYAETALDEPPPSDGFIDDDLPF